MAPVFRLLLIVAALVGAVRPVQAQDLSDADRTAAVSAIAAARSGDWTQAYAAAGHSTNPLPTQIVRWLDYTRSDVTGRFADISQFIEQNPDWPGQKILRRRAEEALASESDDVAAKGVDDVSQGGEIVVQKFRELFGTEFRLLRETIRDFREPRDIQ